MEGDPEFLKFLSVDWINGFGFQCSDSKDLNPPRLYIGKIFLDKPDESRGYPLHDVDTTTVINTEIIPLLGPGYTRDDIWCTDYIGHEFVTVHASRYKDIPRIITTILATGKYRFRTHNGNTSYTALFYPGEVYSKETHERKLVETLRENFECFAKNTDQTERFIWERMKEMGGFRQFLRNSNYITDEGRAFCLHIRETLGKSTYSKYDPYNQWEWYRNAVNNYDLIPEKSAIRAESPKKAKLDTDECMVCMDRVATTTVLPCGCRVVCDECSIGLRNTADTKTCIRCRNPITHVAYEKNNDLEEK